MTFVSALFSRTHLNANYFAVLNESFKVISLFSYQSSLSCCCSATFVSYQIFKCLSTTFLTFFKVICFCCVTHATAHIYYHKHLRLSTTFLFFLAVFQQLSYIIMYPSACQQLFHFYNCERRRRDLNPRAAVNDLHPFQGCPFGQLGYFSELKQYMIIDLVDNGESGIRTHAPLRTNGFQDRLVMTTSISLQFCFALFDQRKIYYTYTPLPCQQVFFIFLHFFHLFLKQGYIYLLFLYINSKKNCLYV